MTENDPHTKTTYILAIVIVILCVLIAYLVLPDSANFLRTQVVQEIDPGVEVQVSHTLDVGTSPDMEPGVYKVQLEITDDEGNLMARSEDITVTIPADDPPSDDPPADDPPADDPPSDDPPSNDPPSNDPPVGGPPPAGEPDPDDDGDDGDDGGGGDNGGDEGDGGYRTFIFSPKDHFKENNVGEENVTGLESTVVFDEKAILEKQNIKIPADNYYMYMIVNHDAPGPVKAAIALNGKTWKAVQFPEADGKWRLHKVGQLRDYSGGKVKFGFLNDRYEPDINIDRNLILPAFRGWALSTNPNLESFEKPRNTSKCLADRRVSLGPRLNAILRDVAEKNGVPSERVVTPDAWKYWYVRLGLASCQEGSIRTEKSLRAKAEYWLTANNYTHFYPL